MEYSWKTRIRLIALSLLFAVESAADAIGENGQIGLVFEWGEKTPPLEANFNAHRLNIERRRLADEAENFWSKRVRLSGQVDVQSALQKDGTLQKVEMRSKFFLVKTEGIPRALLSQMEE